MLCSHQQPSQEALVAGPKPTGGVSFARNVQSTLLLTHCQCSPPAVQPLILSPSLQRSSVQDLQRLRPAGMTEEVFLNQLTQHWYNWPFFNQPFWVTVRLQSGSMALSSLLYAVQVRVVDMYMVEGPKILYRLGLSALRLYATHSQPTGRTHCSRLQATPCFSLQLC